MLRRLQADESYSAAIFWSIALHAGIVLLLVFRFHFDSPELPSVGADVIEAVVVEVSVLEAMEQKKLRQAEQAQAERRRREAERRAAEEQKLRAEQERKLALQRQEAERKAAEQKRLQEQRQKEEEARKAEERAQLEAAQRREQEQLHAEAAAAAQAQAEQKELASARELYMLAIQQKVQRHWIKVPSAVPGQVCRMVIRQIPGGEVISVEMESCDGDSALQRSVEQAIYMASPLPTPPDPRVFDRALRFTFEVK